MTFTTGAERFFTGCAVFFHDPTVSIYLDIVGRTLDQKYITERKMTHVSHFPHIIPAAIVDAAKNFLILGP